MLHGSVLVVIRSHMSVLFKWLGPVLRIYLIFELQSETRLEINRIRLASEHENLSIGIDSSHAVIREQVASLRVQIFPAVLQR